MGLFRAIEPQDEPLAGRPLADRMRPQTLDEFIGQEDLLGPGKPLRTQIERDDLSSMLFWGPAGMRENDAGAHHRPSHEIRIHPFQRGALRHQGNQRGDGQGRRRPSLWRSARSFSSTKCTASIARSRTRFLPHVEAGNILLIGATTENPSFEVISPLLSRMKVYILKALSAEQVAMLLRRALARSNARSWQRKYRDQRRNYRAHCDPCERRCALGLQHARGAGFWNRAGRGLAAASCRRRVLEEVLQKKLLPYDKSGEEHFNLISALHKSVRNSDPDAALYWLARMLESGEDPLYLARRMVRMASEDIGLAEPNALAVTLAAKEAFDFLGPPEGNLALAQAAVYLSLAPKSNAVYKAYGEVQEDLKNTIAEPVPLHLRNAVTGLMSNVGYGKGYQYAHDARRSSLI